MFSVVVFFEGGRKDEDSYSTSVNTTEDAGKNDKVRNYSIDRGLANFLTERLLTIQFPCIQRSNNNLLKNSNKVWLDLCLT